MSDQLIPCIQNKFLIYSMIFLNCNIRWGHNAKTRRASQILKEAPERWEFAVFCWEIPGTYSLNLFLFRNFELKGIFCKKGDFIMMLVELPSFRMLLLLNGLSYWSLIGLKWMIFWCSLRRLKEEESISKHFHTRHRYYSFFLCFLTIALNIFRHNFAWYCIC